MEEIVVRRPRPAPAPVQPLLPAPVPPKHVLVEGLFTTPQSLAAAVVASEILQPPVALRR